MPIWNSPLYNPLPLLFNSGILAYTLESILVLIVVLCIELYGIVSRHRV